MSGSSPPQHEFAEVDVRIGELAERTGASPRSLRYYEQQRLLRSERSPSGQRLYDQEMVDRVRLVRELLAAGLSTQTIREVLPCINDPASRTPWLEQRLTEELARIEDQLACLRKTRQTLAGVIVDVRPE